MKKVLIVTYYWPPAGGPGVQRWVKFVKYLCFYGIEPVVYVPQNPFYPLQDPQMGNDLPPDITILRQKTTEPYSLAKYFSPKATKEISAGILPTHKPSWAERLLLWVRANLFIPDARVGWVSPSVKFLSQYLTAQGISTLITTSPPHSLQLIGLHLKQRLPHLHWIADLRDPWVTIGYHSALPLSSWARKRHFSLEEQVLRTASHIVVTSPSTKREFECKTPQPISVITNGYDDEALLSAPCSTHFTLAHIGSLLSGRNHPALWQALGQLVAQYPLFRAQLRIVLAGKVAQSTYESLEKYGLLPHTTLMGYVSHQQALLLQQQAQMLLLLEINSPDTQAIIPGKLFEYLAARRYILALGPQQWDAAAIVQGLAVGSTPPCDDTEQIRTAILHAFELYLAGQLKVEDAHIAPYHRKALTAHLADIIHQGSS